MTNQIAPTRTPRSSSSSGRTVELRPIEPADRDEAARIVYEAFAGIHDHHRFARDFPTLEAALQLTTNFITHPSIYGVVAEIDGRIVGSNFLDERGPVRGVGPITVDPAVQGRGVGRELMQAVLDRGADAMGIRLLQDAFNTGSLSLYASLGFDVAEPVALMSGRPRGSHVGGVEVRPLEPADLGPCQQLHRRVHGFARTAELEDALASPHFSPMVATREGRVVAYAATLNFFPAAHAVAKTQVDMAGLIAGALATTEEPGSFLLPTRQTELFRWCLGEGLRIVKPMTYMTVGRYETPTGSWIPSVLY
jgi:predicted N-acetyltransferase YhbS